MHLYAVDLETDDKDILAIQKLLKKIAVKCHRWDDIKNKITESEVKP